MNNAEQLIMYYVEEKENLKRNIIEANEQLAEIVRDSYDKSIQQHYHVPGLLTSTRMHLVVANLILIKNNCIDKIVTINHSIELIKGESNGFK